MQHQHASLLQAAEKEMARWLRLCKLRKDTVCTRCEGGGRLYKTPPYHHVSDLPLMVKWRSPGPLPPP